jgi:hypothetical protein
VLLRSSQTFSLACVCTALIPCKGPGDRTPWVHCFQHHQQVTSPTCAYESGNNDGSVIHSGCCNKNSIDWVTYKQHLLLTVLKAGIPRSGCKYTWYQVKVHFLIQIAPSSTEDIARRDKRALLEILNIPQRPVC